ncbi:hypothetical protein LSTR_LSTR004704 [Laodelphax striatellus]|uniref:Centromere protein I n=1 Tax=Laodelphax striatellus TaxID=195883 RepID=A0A482WUN9_LAOST|nr:hypothetical protein LSTR_LSTR004704 [Laodelphax striatellus]
MELQPLGDLFDRIQLFKNGLSSSSMPEFVNCLTEISSHASQDGLSDSQLTDLAHFISNADLRSSTVKLLFNCLVPKKCVPIALTKKIVTHLLMNYRKLTENDSSQKIIPMLQWIIGVIEFKLTDVKIIDGFYRLYFFMLDYTNVNVHEYIAQIIYMLTKPDDVVEEKVYHIQKIMAKACDRSSYLVALLSKFKSYKPQLVPKNIPNGKTLDATHCLPEKWTIAFKNAARRNSPEESMQVDSTTDQTNTLATNGKFLPARRCLEKVVNSYITYSNLSCSKSVPLHKIRLEDIDNLYDLQQNINVIELPTNILSLLWSDIGMRYLALADHGLQERFAISLSDLLDKVFLKMALKSSYEEKDTLLRSIANLETMMQQGISVVTRFLGKYLVCWDGVKFRKSLLSLIEWATFSSYAEFEELILTNLFNHFCTSQWEVKVEIINCLCNLLTNMHLVDLRRFKKGTKPPFLGVHAQWLSEHKTLHCIKEAIEYFIMIGLIAEPQSNALLHRAITFYSMVFQFEKNMPDMTVVHFSVVYRSMFAQNSAAFRRVCELILSYRSKIVQMDPAAANNLIEDKIKLVGHYVNDIMNCLWTGKALSNSESGIIFQELNSSAREELKRITGGNPDKAFILSNNMLLIPYIYTILKGSPELNLRTVTAKDKIWEILEIHLEEVANLITEALESDNQNSGMLSYL